MAVDAEKALNLALASLASVAVQSNQCPPKVLAAFSSELQRLQVESLQIRARSQAMQARGDAYFDRWHENLEQVKDPTLRQLAEKHRPDLHDAFMRIKQLSGESREAFGPFVSGLRSVRNTLEKDPGSLEAAATRQSIATAQGHGEHVKTCLLGIRRELDAMMALLKFSGATHPNEGAG